MAEKKERYISVATLIAAVATIGLIALIWFAIEYSDKRIWLAIGLLMALAPFGMVWRLARSHPTDTEAPTDSKD